MPDDYDITSLSLLTRARTQDQEAWGQLVHLYGPLVQKWCRLAGLQDDDTADVFQETFQAVARNLDNFRPTKSVASFRSWLKTIVRTKTIDLLRRRQRPGQAAGGTEAQMRMAEVVDPLDDDNEAESQADEALIVQRAMELIRPEFSERNWKGFLEVAINGRAATDVAESLGVAAQTVRQANYRIRRRLKLVLEDLVQSPLTTDKEDESA